MDNQYEPHDIGKGNENEKQGDYKEIYGIAKILKVFTGIILLYFILGMTHYALGDSAKMATQVLFMVSNLVAIICVSLIGMRVKVYKDKNSLFKEFI
jgi:biotin transporter BioY